MPQRDVYHDCVKRALEKDGWVITHDPLALSFGQGKVYADLGAELPIGAEKGGRKIAVEVKSLLGPSQVTEFERGLGQYVFYGALLARQDPDRMMFLAVPKPGYDTLFLSAQGQDLIESEGLRIIVYHPAKEVIVQWIEPPSTVR